MILVTKLKHLSQTVWSLLLAFLVCSIVFLISIERERERTTTKYCMDARSLTSINKRTFVDWLVFTGTTSLLQVTTNLLYHCFVEFLGWLSSKVEEEWKILKSDNGWWQILQRSWHSKLPLIEKVFIWRVLIGGLSLGLALKRRGLATGNGFFCTIQMEDSTH